MTHLLKPLAGTPLNYNTLMIDRLTALWPMNEGAGTTTIDNASNDFDGTCNNMSSTNWVGSKWGSALTFNGSDESISLPDLGFTSVDQMTMVAWVKSSTVSSMRLLSMVLTGNEQFFIGTDASGLARVFARGAAIESTATASANAITDGKWHLVVGTVNEIDGRVRLYVDGIDEGSADHGSAFTNVNLSICGISRYPAVPFSQYLNGELLTVMIYKRILTPKEILDMYYDAFNMFKQPNKMLQFAGIQFINIPALVHHYRQQGMM